MRRLPIPNFTMHERHENEQYFFDDRTLQHLVTFLRSYAHPCVLCAPLLGRTLQQAGHRVRILDIDERFASTPGFRHWNIHRPEWTGEAYDIIVCDPPFFNISLSRLFVALRMLARNDVTQPLLLSYLSRRQSSILGTFAPFQLEPTGYYPTYVTVQTSDRNEIEFFGNLGAAAHARLRQGTPRD